MNPTLTYSTEGYNGYAVKYSPFYNSRIAVAASANYGLVGNGRLYILQLTPEGIRAEKWYDTQDAIFDTAWSEIHAEQILAGCGDGSIKLFDINVKQFPVGEWKGHNREVFGVHWNLVTKDTFASSSWDGTVKIWSPERPNPMATLVTHSCTYSTSFSPHSPFILSCVSADSHIRVYDLRTPASASNHQIAQIPIHGPGPVTGPRAVEPAEALTHDWNKYRDSVVATGGVDRIIRTFDVRNPNGGPLALGIGHQYAIRKLAWSPHLPDMLLTASYDMSCRIWSDAIGGGFVEKGRMDAHTEFATGVDWCMFGDEGWCASVGWDQKLLVWDVRNFMR